jgi:hypothetical protein
MQRGHQCDIYQYASTCAFAFCLHVVLLGSCTLLIIHSSLLSGLQM